MNICFALLPYFTDMFCREGYTDVSLAIYDIMMTFAKNGSINTIFFNYIFVSTKYKINTRYWDIYNMCGFIIDLCISCWWCKRWISQPAELVMSSFYQFVQRALKSAVTTEQRGNSWFIWLKRISNFAQRILNSSWLWLMSGKHRLKNIFRFVIEFL